MSNSVGAQLTINTLMKEMIERGLYFTIEWDGSEWEVRADQGVGTVHSSRSRPDLFKTLQAVLADFPFVCEICGSKAAAKDEIKHTDEDCFK